MLSISDDQTRVILKEQNTSGGDYINANYVNVSVAM